MVSCPVVMAALGPRMLEIAGRLADGTVTWMTGPNTLRDHVVPRLQESAAAVGNPPPRVCVGMPVAVTDHPDRARARADRLFQHYAVLPSYRSMLEREGVEGPGDIAIVGRLWGCSCTVRPCPDDPAPRTGAATGIPHRPQRRTGSLSAGEFDLWGRSESQRAGPSG